MQAGNIDSTSLIVQTRQGKLRGIVKDGVCEWRGVRYAKAPIGDLRFHSPQPPDKWDGIKNAAEFGSIAPQMKRALGEKQSQNEDCLFLNVWSPAADEKKRPVMFWIHGGGFMAGSGSSDLYDGSQFAKNGDVVIVSINYRLGALGFLYFKDMPNNNFESNLGIKDQIAALQWVKENIAAFGGDPNAVTIFGESAGAVSVLTLMGTPAAKGLFTIAISESGAPDMLWRPKMATDVTTRFLKVLGITPDNLSKLKTIPADSLNSAMEKFVQIMRVEPSLAKTFSPTIDGDLIPYDLATAISKNQAAGIPLLIGTNNNEANLFALRKLKMVPVNAEQLEPYMARVSADSRKRLIKAYKEYPHKSGVLSIITDGIFTFPSIHFAELQSGIAPTYMYRFDWYSMGLGLVGLKACHGVELPLVFGTLDTGFGKKLGIMGNKKTIRALSHSVQQSWINFARTGNPNSSGQNTWQRYDAAGRNTLIFDKNIYSTADPKKEQREAWKGLTIFE